MTIVRIPIRKHFLELLQSGQRLRVIGERLARLAGRLKRVRLLHLVVDGEVLVIGTLLGARRRQCDGEGQTRKCGKTFHAGKIAERGMVWQRSSRTPKDWIDWIDGYFGHKANP